MLSNVEKYVERYAPQRVRDPRKTPREHQTSCGSIWQAIFARPTTLTRPDKAHGLLGWQPVWNFSETVAQTATWYRSVIESKAQDTARPLTLVQIQTYVQQAAERQIEWAKS